LGTSPINATTDQTVKPQAGKLYLMSGRTSYPSSTVDLATSPEIVCRMFGGLSFANIGKVSATGDINGDGYDDILMTDFAAQNNRGAVGVIFGKTTLPLNIDFAFIEFDFSIIGADSNGILGETLFSSEFDDDQIDDILIGVPQAITENGENSGMVHLVKGNTNLTGTLNLIETSPDEVYYGATAGDHFGSSLTLFNFNGDDKVDICIGAATGGENEGQIHTVFGGLPYILNRSPNHKSHDIETNASVNFDLFDDHEGVDLNSVNVLIGGVEYTSVDPNFSYSGDASKYSITINPVDLFGYNQVVDVTVYCEDLSDWIIPTQSYYFTTKEDNDPPYTLKWVPAPDSTKVGVDANVTFFFRDAGEGVNIASVRVGINETEYSVGNPSFSFEGTPKNYFISIDPPVDFNYGDTVNVTIDGSDLALSPNVMPTDRYSFFCMKDTVPPEIFFLKPTNGDTISKQEILQFEVTDDETGINPDSISFFFNETDLTSSLTINPNTTGNGYFVTFSPDAGYFHPNGQHQLKIRTTDLARTPNTTSGSITIFVVPDVLPPFTRNHFPIKYDVDAPTNTRFKVDIKDNLMGVDASSIQITLNGTNIITLPNTTISDIEDGYHIEYIPATRLSGLVNVTINAQDLNNPPNVMIPDSYSFQTVVDTESPYLTSQDPAADEQAVSENTNIYLEIKDDLTGVDSSSIVIIVEGTDVTTQSNIEKISKGYSLFYHPEQPFELTETVSVNVIANDYGINPNTLNETYYFYIIGDTIPPVVTNMNPYPNQIGVPLDTDIYLEIIDNGDGVDTSSIRLYVNSEIVDPVITSINSTHQYSLSYNPPEIFQYADEVEISVFANDLATVPNVMNEFSYSFRCIDDDITPPFLTELEPGAAEGVPVDTRISFKILDLESGIDLNSLVLKLNNDVMTDYTFRPETEANGTGYYVEYYPPADFQYGETVQLFIYAEDHSSNHNELPPDQRNHIFVCEVDTTPPQVLTVQPVNGESGYPNTTLYFKFTDTQSGIDTSSFLLKTNNQKVTGYTDTLENDIYTVTFEPETDHDLGTMLIEIKLDDFSLNRLDTVYSFLVLPDTFPPYIVPQIPKPNAHDVLPGSKLIVDILDKGIGIDKPTIQLFINNTEEFNFVLEFNPYDYNPDSLGYRLSHTLRDDFYDGQFITIRIKANDLSDVLYPNRVDSTYSFTILLPENEIIAIPPTIHPGYGDINRETKIWIDTDAAADDISGRIFNVRGKPVKKLDILDQNSKKLAIWNGTDENEFLVSGGVYIFQIKIKSKIHQGSVIVVR